MKSPRSMVEASVVVTVMNNKAQLSVDENWSFRVRDRVGRTVKINQDLPCAHENWWLE